MEKRNLLKSQQELVRFKLNQAQNAHAEAQATINLVAVELGIEIGENWRLAPDLSCFEKPEPEKKSAK